MYSRRKQSEMAFFCNEIIAQSKKSIILRLQKYQLLQEAISRTCLNCAMNERIIKVTCADKNFRLVALVDGNSTAV